MAAGGPGDDPLIDILTWDQAVFDTDIDDLIRVVEELGGFDSLLAIEYVRAVHTLLSLANHVATSDADAASIVRSNKSQLRDVLRREVARLRDEPTPEERLYLMFELLRPKGLESGMFSRDPHPMVMWRWSHEPPGLLEEVRAAVASCETSEEWSVDDQAHDGATEWRLAPRAVGPTADGGRAREIPNTPPSLMDDFDRLVASVADAVAG